MAQSIPQMFASMVLLTTFAKKWLAMYNHQRHSIIWEGTTNANGSWNTVKDCILLKTWSVETGKKYNCITTMHNINGIIVQGGVKMC